MRFVFLVLTTTLLNACLSYQGAEFWRRAIPFYTAWSILRDDGAMTVNESTDKQSLVRTAINGTMIND